MASWLPNWHDSHDPWSGLPVDPVVSPGLMRRGAVSPATGSTDKPGPGWSLWLLVVKPNGVPVCEWRQG